MLRIDHSDHSSGHHPRYAPQRLRQRINKWPRTYTIITRAPDVEMVNKNKMTTRWQPVPMPGATGVLAVVGDEILKLHPSAQLRTKR